MKTPSDGAIYSMSQTPQSDAILERMVSVVRAPQINAQEEGKVWEINLDVEDGLIERPVIADGDWELGPACSTEHEECESCQ